MSLQPRFNVCDYLEDHFSLSPPSQTHLRIFGTLAGFKKLLEYLFKGLCSASNNFRLLFHKIPLFSECLPLIVKRHREGEAMNLEFLHANAQTLHNSHITMHMERCGLHLSENRSSSTPERIFHLDRCI